MALIYPQEYRLQSRQCRMPDWRHVGATVRVTRKLPAANHGRIEGRGSRGADPEGRIQGCGLRDADPEARFKDGGSGGSDSKRMDLIDTDLGAQI